MNCIDETEQTPFDYTLNIIGGKWKMRILYQLAHSKILRFNELKRNIPKISYKMLNEQLKQLENDDIIIRNEYNQVPPKVEYSLSEKGLTLIPVLDSMCSWGKKQRKVSD